MDSRTQAGVRTLQEQSIAFISATVFFSHFDLCCGLTCLPRQPRFHRLQSCLNGRFRNQLSCPWIMLSPEREERIVCLCCGLGRSPEESLASLGVGCEGSSGSACLFSAGLCAVGREDVRGRSR